MPASKAAQPFDRAQESMGAYLDLFLRALAQLEAVQIERTFLELNMSGLFISIILGEDWHKKRIALNENPDTWMLNGNEAWLAAHPVVAPDMRRVIYSHRVIRLSDALFTVSREIAGFDRLRQRFLKRKDTRALFAEAEIASLLIHNGCSVQIVGESGVRGQDFDLLVTARGVSVSVEVTAIEGGALSARTILNKLNGKRDQVPANRPAVLYIRVPETWMRNYTSAFLVFNEAIKRFMRSSRRFNAIVLVWEGVTPAEGGGVLHRLMQPVYNNRPRWIIPDLTVFTLKRDKWGLDRYSVSFLDSLRSFRIRKQIENN